MEKNFATVVPIDVMCLHTCTAVARLTLALAKLSCLIVASGLQSMHIVISKLCICL